MGFNENIDSSFFFLSFFRVLKPHITYLRRFEPRIDFFNLLSIVFIRAFFSALNNNEFYQFAIYIFLSLKACLRKHFFG